MSEILWATLKSIRAYSTMMLSIYRYMAVFKTSIFNKIKTSNKYNIISVVFSWLIPIIIFFIAKYSTNSTYGPLCLDGFNQNVEMLYVYIGLSSIFGFIIPSVIVFIIYIKISIELNKNSKIISNTSQNLNSRISNNNFNNKQKYQKQRDFSTQFFSVNILEIISYFLAFVLGIDWRQINPYFDMFFFIDCVSPVDNLIMAGVPILLLYYNSIKGKFNLKCWK